MVSSNFFLLGVLSTKVPANSLQDYTKSNITYCSPIQGTLLLVHKYSENFHVYQFNFAFCLLTYLFTYTLTYLLILSSFLPSFLPYLLTYFLTCLLAYLFTCLLAYLLTCLLAYLLTCLLTD